ncbi:hypothetical protein RAB80_006004 [Fusarium oxysporum f. sp. vasinfectum]|nr:hypothetical protein RAB80_006004 [Fusarium oxysporum f. sp. vasinfectum]
MAFTLQPHEGHLLRIFLVLVSFLLAPASPAVVEPHVRVFAKEEPESPRKAPPSFLDFPSQHQRRDGSCPISGDHWCGNDLPGDFCCSSQADCKVLAANTTALCCPKNSKGECEIILPITCNIERQNPSTNPEAEVKTLALDRKLKRFETSEVPDRVFQPPSASADPTTSTTESTTPDDNEEEEKGSGISPTGAVTAGTVAGVCCLVGVGIFVWMKWFRKKGDRDTPEMSLARESWGYFSTRSAPSTLHLHLARGPDDKFIVTPTTAGFTPSYPPLAPIVDQNQSPVELPATPVSLCMWSNFENAAVEEPKLAYIIPAKRQ